MGKCPECGHCGTLIELEHFEVGDCNKIGRNDLTLCNLFYELALREEKYLQKQDIAGDYRLCKALASCYELQDYLAGRIALLGSKE